MKSIAQAFDCLVDGDKLTNDEVIALYTQLEAVVKACAPLGAHFRLAHKEAAVQCAYLRDIMFARNIKIN